MARRQVGLAHQRPQCKLAPHARGRCGGSSSPDASGHSARGAPVRSPRPVRRSCAAAPPSTISPCSRASRAVTGPMHTPWDRRARAQRADEPANGRGARERDRIDPPSLEGFTRVRGELSRESVSVCVDARRATIPSRRARPRVPPARCRPAHTAPVPRRGERARERRRGERRRHEVRVAPRPSTERLAVPSPIAATFGRPPNGTVSRAREHLDRRATGERDPRELAALQLAQRPRERGRSDRRDLDRRRHDRPGAARAPAAHEHGRPVGAGASPARSGR